MRHLTLANRPTSRLFVWRSRYPGPFAALDANSMHVGRLKGNCLNVRLVFVRRCRVLVSRLTWIGRLALVIVRVVRWMMLAALGLIVEVMLLVMGMTSVDCRDGRFPTIVIRLLAWLRWWLPY